MSEIKEEVVGTETEIKPVIHDTSLPIITMKKCLIAGCHHGHNTRLWNPKMAKYIYGQSNGIYVIDLNKTVEKVIEAYVSLRSLVRDNGKVLFVGTKEKVKEHVVNAATRSGSFYITNRWLGGTLTNFKTIAKRIKYLNDIETREANGLLDNLSKKDLAELKKEKDKLTSNLEGIKEMRRLPQALFVCDPTKEAIAVKEARKLGIKVFGIVDTNADPDLIDFPIPANDDAEESVKLILNVISDAIVEGRTDATSDQMLVAYTKDEGEEVTMKEVINIFNKEALERRARYIAERREKYERMQKERGIKDGFRHKENKETKNSEVKAETKKEENK